MSGSAKLEARMSDFMSGIESVVDADDILEFLYKEQKIYPAHITACHGTNFHVILPFSLGSDAYGKPIHKVIFSSFEAPMKKKKHKIVVGDYVLISGGFISGIFSKKDMKQVQSVYEEFDIETPSDFFPRKEEETHVGFVFIEPDEDSDEESVDDADEDAEDDEADESVKPKPKIGEDEDEEEDCDDILAAFSADFFGGGGAKRPIKTSKLGGAKKISDDGSDDDSTDSDPEVEAEKKSKKDKKDKKAKKRSKGHKTSSGRSYKGGGC